MEPIELVEGLARFAGRGAGTDAERRAAAWLAEQLRADGQEVAVETFWSRPNSALAHAWHAALAVAGSLIALASPPAGVTVVGLALASLFADWLTGFSLGRRLTHEQASQNIVATHPVEDPNPDRVRLILTANYDAGRVGLVYRDGLRRPVATLRRALKGLTPGWLGWLSVALVWLLVIAILRLTGHASHAIAVAQLPPTAVLVLAFALLVELGSSGWSPAAGDNGSGVAVAVRLAHALQMAPPANIDVELVLTGAGDGAQLGLSHYLRRRRDERRRANTVVLGIAACTAGSPRWWSSDGPLIPLRYARPLRTLAEEIAADEPHLHLRPHRGRGTTPAAPARIRGIPAISLGCLDPVGLSPRSHQPTDKPAAIDHTAVDAALQLGLLMVDAIDATIGELGPQQAATPA